MSATYVDRIATYVKHLILIDIYLKISVNITENVFKANSNFDGYRLIKSESGNHL